MSEYNYRNDGWFGHPKQEYPTVPSEQDVQEIIDLNRASDLKVTRITNAALSGKKSPAEQAKAKGYSVHGFRVNGSSDRFDTNDAVEFCAKISECLCAGKNFVATCYNSELYKPNLP